MGEPQPQPDRGNERGGGERRTSRSPAHQSTPTQNNSAQNTPERVKDRDSGRDQQGNRDGNRDREGWDKERDEKERNEGVNVNANAMTPPSKQQRKGWGPPLAALPLPLGQVGGQGGGKGGIAMMMMKPSDYDDAAEEVEEVLTQREYEKLLAEKDPQVEDILPKYLYITPHPPPLTHSLLRHRTTPSHFSPPSFPSLLPPISHLPPPFFMIGNRRRIKSTKAFGGTTRSTDRSTTQSQGSVSKIARKTRSRNFVFVFLIGGGGGGTWITIRTSNQSLPS